MKPALKSIMLAGTGSDVGKSVIATALCRIFLQDGWRPAPFKAQNMALNSAVTPEGGEIGRAQAVQAEAAGIEPHTDMNPVLLKPSSQLTSQVVLNGRSVGNSSSWEYFHGEGRATLRREVHEAYDRLTARYNPIVMEGAGSIAEINLRENDVVNMPMAAHADAAVVLVADIDRGGVFASVYGSTMLQTPEDRVRIRGIIVNKFRGDLRLFDEGRRMMEKLCGVPVLGVVPHFTDIVIEAEDSVTLAVKRDRAGNEKINVAVVRLPHISNFTDFDALECDPRLHLYYTDDPGELARAEIIIIPGSKSTLADLAAIRDRGVARAIVDAHGRGTTVLGICGGYQMMGREVCDPDGVEGAPGTLPGLGLLPVVTTIRGEKITRRRGFRLAGDERDCAGYEIHMGRTERVDEAEDCEAVAMLDDGAPEGCCVGRAMGTYLHGILDNAPFTELLLGAATHPELRDHEEFKQRQYDRLADHVRRHVDMARIYKILSPQ
jgi:adenosylcobyric acid synthase